MKSSQEDLSALLHLDCYKKKKDCKFCASRGKVAVRSVNDTDKLEESDLKDSRPGVNETPGQSSPPGSLQEELEITYKSLINVQNLDKDDTEKALNFLDSESDKIPESSQKTQEDENMSESLRSDFVKIPEAPKSWCFDDEESLGLLELFQTPDTTLDLQNQDSFEADSDSEDVVMLDVEQRSPEPLEKSLNFLESITDKISESSQNKPNENDDNIPQKIPDVERIFKISQKLENCDVNNNPVNSRYIPGDISDIMKIPEPPKCWRFDDDVVKIPEHPAPKCWWFDEGECLDLLDLIQSPDTALDSQNQDSPKENLDSHDAFMQDVIRRFPVQLLTLCPETMFSYLDSDSDKISERSQNKSNVEHDNMPGCSRNMQNDVNIPEVPRRQFDKDEARFLELKDLSDSPGTTLDSQYQDSFAASSDNEDVLMHDVERRSPVQLSQDFEKTQNLLDSDNDKISERSQNEPNVEHDNMPGCSRNIQSDVNIPEVPRHQFEKDEARFLELKDLLFSTGSTLDSQDQDSLEADSDSEGEFIQGAHVAHHSSEQDLSLPPELVAHEFDFWTLSTLSPQQLGAGIALNKRLMRRLQKELAEREKLASVSRLINMFVRPGMDWPPDFRAGSCIQAMAKGRGRLPPSQ